MAAFSESDLASSWLKQFDGDELKIARQLIDEILLVTRDELNRGLVGLLDVVAKNRKEKNRKVALYAERKMSRTNGILDPFFPGTQTGRATGSGVAPVAADDPEVGSEGTIANLITSYARLHRNVILSHSGPDELRSEKVGSVVIFTDFIGSGKRVYEMLEAFGRVATLRSWKSYKYINYYVIAYSGTSDGIQMALSSHLNPQILTVVGCPTVHNVFRGEKLEQVLKLCRRYAANRKMYLGFKKGGALIAFAHGMPNNAPSLLHTGKDGWKPLFKNRSTLDADTAFPISTAAKFAERAASKINVILAQVRMGDEADDDWIKTMLVLSAVRDGASKTQNISAASHVPITQVEEILSTLLLAQWVSRRTTSVSLTDLGRHELQRLRRRRIRKPVLPTQEIPFYFPTQLRDR